MNYGGKAKVAILWASVFFATIGLLGAVGCASHEATAPKITDAQLSEICAQLFDLVQMYQLDNQAQLELLRAELRQLRVRIDALEFDGGEFCEP